MIEGKLILVIGIKVKFDFELSKVTGLATRTTPVLPSPTLALIMESLSTAIESDRTPPKLTVVVPVKPLPIICIQAPVVPLDGENELITGLCRAVNVNLTVVSVLKPTAFFTNTGPVDPLPTIAFIVESLKTVKAEAVSELSFTIEAPRR